MLRVYPAKRDYVLCVPFFANSSFVEYFGERRLRMASHVTCYVFHATCYVLRVPCYVLRVPCYVLCAMCSMLSVYTPNHPNCLNPICHWWMSRKQSIHKSHFTLLRKRTFDTDLCHLFVFNYLNCRI